MLGFTFALVAGGEAFASSLRSSASFLLSSNLDLNHLSFKFFFQIVCTVIGSIVVSSEPICVVTGDGRIILGELVGHDQVQNLILNDAKERVYSSGSPPEIVDLGLYVEPVTNDTHRMLLVGSRIEFVAVPFFLHIVLSQKRSFCFICCCPFIAKTTGT